jgi:hypothetical protein
MVCNALSHQYFSFLSNLCPTTILGLDFIPRNRAVLLELWFVIFLAQVLIYAVFGFVIGFIVQLVRGEG